MEKRDNIKQGFNRNIREIGGNIKRKYLRDLISKKTIDMIYKRLNVLSLAGRVTSSFGILMKSNGLKSVIVIMREG